MPLTADQLQECLVPRQQLIQYASAMDIVDVLRPSDVASCFTSAYGRSPVRSGSYVRTEDGVRRLTPTEIVGLLGFPRQFSWPCDVSFRQAWRLAGNSLSVPVVRQVLTPLIDNAASQESALADVRHDP